MTYEQQYRQLVLKVLTTGQNQTGRNGGTRSIFMGTLNFDLALGFPLLEGRKMYPRGILGEFAAFLEGPKNLRDFEKHGCNYWADWAKEDGSINVDYGNAWTNFNGVDQIANLIKLLENNPDDRRLLVSGWNPVNLPYLDLPCCHYAYQFYVRRELGAEFLDMAWHQRSTDLMIGAPSDAVLAASWLIALGTKTGFIPGRCHMTLGNTHIYEEHFTGVEEYLDRTPPDNMVEWHYKAPEYSAEEAYKLKFVPNNLDFYFYEPLEPIDFLLKA